MSRLSFRTPWWLLTASLLALGVLLLVVVDWRKSTDDADSNAVDSRQKNAPLAGKDAPGREDAEAIRRKLFAEVEANGLAALNMIDESWPVALRRSLRRDLLEHHGIQQPLESLDWLAKHPRIDGSGPLGVELSFSLHARAGLQAGKMEPWQTALERLDKISSHGTQREHLAYLQSALMGMRSGGLLPFSAREIHSMRLRPETKAVALACLGDLRGGLELLRPGGSDYPAAHLATREWLTLGKLPLSLSETADRLLAFAPPGDKGPAEVARTLRHPSLDRSIALWLSSHPAGPDRDEALNLESAVGKRMGSNSG